MTDQTIIQPDERLSLRAEIEALLFVSPGAVSISQLSTALGESNRIVERELKILEDQYQHRGFRIQRHLGKVQLVSAPQAGQIIEIFLGLEATSRMSQAALETLSIIAYQQPVTRPQVDAIRGVNSDGVMKTLLSKGLIQEVGRAPGPGRPILYTTTPDFLGHFGLTSIDELPPLHLAQVDGSTNSDNGRILKE